MACAGAELENADLLRPESSANAASEDSQGGNGSQCRARTDISTALSLRRMAGLRRLASGAATRARPPSSDLVPSRLPSGNWALVPRVLSGSCSGSVPNSPMIRMVQPQLPPPKLDVREHTPRQQVSTEEQSGTPEPLPPADGDSLAGPSVSGSAVFIQPMVAQLEWPEVMASTFDWGPRDF